jgi:hypothetical protein
MYGIDLAQILGWSADDLEFRLHGFGYSKTR